MSTVDGIVDGGAPWYKNTVVEYAKHSVRLQNMSSCLLSKVLVIYCGGTIGMLNDAVHGYYPVAGHLSALLARSDTFNDPAFQERLQRGLSEDSEEYDVSSMRSERGPILAMPPSIYGKRIAYQILEYDPLKDSSNMSMDDWIRLASDIEAHYHGYDAFVILHGTDTMAYSASALSFLLENLGKTVILTGSQIPFSEIRNDAKDNLLGALTMAGHYVIPEVCLFFGNRLYRGNRTSKVNAVGFAAFDSPNLKPLAKLGVNVEIEWAEVLRATEIRPFRAHKQMDANVGCLRIFPGISASSLRAFLRAPMRGVVLETFGTGNAPDDRPELVQAIADAVKGGIVVVNVTQCPKGRVANVYATGNMLSSIGVLSGSDMTAECALAKLSYLLSFPENGPGEMRRLMVESLRGELTVPIASGASGAGASWLGAVLETSLLAATTGHREAVDNTLRPLLFHLAAATGDLEALSDLLRSSFYLDAVDYDGRTALHVAVSRGQLEAVRWLITHGANVHIRDVHGHTVVFEAMEACLRGKANLMRPILDLLIQTGAQNPVPSRRLNDELFRAVAAGDTERLALFLHVGYPMAVIDLCGRNILHIAAIFEHTAAIEALLAEDERTRATLLEGLRTAKDMHGRTPQEYGQQSGPLQRKRGGEAIE